MKYKVHSRINRNHLILYRPTEMKYTPHIYINIHIQGFPYWGMEHESHPHQSKICSFPPPKVIPPTKQQFSSYNSIKTGFLAVVNAPAPFLF